MKNEPLISIAIPNFNYGRYLHRCLGSAVAQEGDDIEILVADNCSSDDSWQVIKSFGDSRIRTWRHSKNIGLFPNWNYLLRQASGKYFKLLPSDDWLEPNFAEETRRLLADMPETRVIAVLLGYRVSDESSFSPQRVSSPHIPSASGIPGVFSPKENFDAALRSLGYAMPTQNLLNTELAQRVGGYLPEDSMRADGIIFSRLLTTEPSWRIVSCDFPVAVTRVHQTNDRYNYSRFSPYRDEIVFLRELSSLTKAESERRHLQELISCAAGQALVSLLIDLVRRKNSQEFGANFKTLVDMRLFFQACVVVPRETFGILMRRWPFSTASRRSSDGY